MEWLLIIYTYNLRLSVGNAMHTTKLSGDTSVHTR